MVHRGAPDQESIMTIATMPLDATVSRVGKERKVFVQASHEHNVMSFEGGRRGYD